MLGLTHIGFALLCSSILKIRLTIFDVIGLALFSILPDIDLPSSELGIILRPLSHKLLEHTTHRGATHSLLFVLGILCPLRFLLPDFHLLAALGLLSHLFLDMLTPVGIEFLWPIKLRLIILDAPVNTGSKADYFIFLISSAIFIYSRISIG
ncbi:MAG: metal-dependent hydrolase [Candidatus Nanoarchaeia archaeon]|nr:metal-dependent hydrolase [Candidatus Haiyanarchaeum thermophilum]MCW1307592.1 metal-dependent hydrolase [Candidatus Haiyanarchaeum thermophilum]MCW1308305.1 metal-dependent hydrolase [Candidatus Haiyanarchaeum thermophilum]MCW1309037.1 metal-dependent hydrolase [Candidatus Haiyanarchaeum thermophilum]